METRGERNQRAKVSDYPAERGGVGLSRLMVYIGLAGNSERSDSHDKGSPGAGEGGRRAEARGKAASKRPGPEQVSVGGRLQPGHSTGCIACMERMDRVFAWESRQTTATLSGKRNEDEKKKERRRAYARAKEKAKVKKKESTSDGPSGASAVIATDPASS